MRGRLLVCLSEVVRFSECPLSEVLLYKLDVESRKLRALDSRRGPGL